VSSGATVVTEPLAANIYLDHNATTPVLPEVRAAMAPYLDAAFGNPSSLHRWGAAAREAVDGARRQVAAALRCAPDEVVFTSGGTEADNAALLGVVAAARSGRRRVVTTAIEHVAVLRACRLLERHGCEVAYVAPGADGSVDPEAIAAAIDERTCLISVMHANNETGVIQPVAAVGELAWHRGIAFHVDAVQTLGRLPVDADRLSADLIAVSAHKLNGPKGVGALYVRRGMVLEPLVHGGGQERGRRAGTENVAGIVGFGEACRIAEEEMPKEGLRLAKLRDRLISRILEVKDTSLNGHPTKRLPNNANFSFKYIDGAALLLKLDDKGIAASTGSACSTESPEPSHVLLAIGLRPEDARGSLRLTLGRWTTEEEVDYVSKVVSEAVEELRLLSPLAR